MSAIAFPSLIVIFNYASNYYQVLDCYGSTIGSVHLEKPDLPVPGDDIHFFNRILRAGLITACRAENGCGSIRARVPGKLRLVRVKLYREIIGRPAGKKIRKTSGEIPAKLGRNFSGLDSFGAVRKFGDVLMRIGLTSVCAPAQVGKLWSIAILVTLHHSNHYTGRLPSATALASQDESPRCHNFVCDDSGI